VTALDAAEKAALVALLRGELRVPHLAAQLEQSGSAVSVLERQTGGNSAQSTLFNHECDMQTIVDQAAVDLACWEADGIRVLSVLDPDYPANLRAAHDRPPALFVSGRLEPGDARSVAVIGTRHPTRQGRATAVEICRHLAHYGYTVVSGLAAGIDREAHCAALAGGARTVAVIGTGLGRCYPAVNASLQRRIAREGAVVSQFWPDEPPSRGSFLLRNAVMSGIALATVIVEASPVSGSMAQARRALGHGRPVFLSERVVEQPWARDFRARPGTYVFRGPSEITDSLARLTDGALVA
jgi:DNA processing protein